ncbi:MULTISPECIES: hypothetical protein [Asticcacaulis]|uniref:hypothetical protein n=1 Tax=Asticcacaulis TaxID=76890 RepID=UPI001AE9A9B2|nr:MULTISPECIES: hypothetical protein [Asticcacaulis]MBP2158661.1 hypothetical protein [Asticcacaulis solisilvae]MDR6799707.1 hypothetical protein [Asticcacaulis sp. BE141]
MVRFHLACLAAVMVALGGCDLMAPKPVDTAAQAVPPPPSGTAVLFADGDMVSLQVRPGDCAKTDCLAFRDGRWRPMAKASVRTLPLLAVSEATGSDYSEALWRTVAPGRAVLLNTSAARQTLSAGHLDGLRVGLANGAHRGYVTIYAIEDSKSAVFSEGHPLGDGRVFLPVNAEVIVHGGTAWLLHQRADRSANLIDLFKVLSRPAAIQCLPGLALDTTQWAGPVEQALSPNLFVSRAIDATKDAARRQAVIAACPLKPADPTLKERLGIRSE